MSALTSRDVLLLSAGGVLGTLARAGLGLVVTRLLGAAFPWGTVVVNLSGCLLFGLAWAIIGAKFGGSELARLCVLTGFLGAFTTFSTYLFETAALLERSQPWLALGNFLLQNAAGLIFLTLGMALGRALN